MTLPPQFLSKVTLQEGQTPGTDAAHYSAIFSHQPPIIGDAAVKWWPSPDIQGGQPVSEGGTPEVVLLLIPGNPGLVESYIDFLRDLHRAAKDGGVRLAIFVQGHIGHAPGLVPEKIREWTIGLDSQVASAVELYDSILKTYPNVKIVLAGHSVGGWIVTQVMHKRPDTVKAAFLLCPTLSNMASTPKGQKLSWLFREPFPTLISSLSRLLTLPLLSLLPHALPLYPDYRNYPPDQLPAVKSFMASPHAIYSMLTMAGDEMNTIGSLGPQDSTIRATCERERSKIYACFAAGDEWVGEELDSVKEMLDKEKVVELKVPHAFCTDLEHSATVAGTCTTWLKEVAAS